MSEVTEKMRAVCGMMQVSEGTGDKERAWKVEAT